MKRKPRPPTDQSPQTICTCADPQPYPSGAGCRGATVGCNRCGLVIDAAQAKTERRDLATREPGVWTSARRITRRVRTAAIEP